MLEFDADVRGGDGFAIARDILESGRALDKMQAIIDAQGRRAFDPEQPALSPLSFEVKAQASGVVCELDNLQFARIARLAGAPKVAGAGVDLLKKLGERVEVGEALYRVHAAYPADLGFAQQEALRHAGMRIGTEVDATSFALET